MEAFNGFQRIARQTIFIKCGIFDVFIVEDNKFSLLHRDSLAVIVVNIHREIKQVLFFSGVMLISALRTNNGVIFINIFFFNRDYLRTIGVKTPKHFVKGLPIHMIRAILSYFFKLLYVFLRGILIPPKKVYMFQFQVHQQYAERFQVIYFCGNIRLR